MPSPAGPCTETPTGTTHHTPNTPPRSPTRVKCQVAPHPPPLPTALRNDTSALTAVHILTPTLTAHSTICLELSTTATATTAAVPPTQRALFSSSQTDNPRYTTFTTLYLPTLASTCTPPPSSARSSLSRSPSRRTSTQPPRRPLPPRRASRSTSYLVVRPSTAHHPPHPHPSKTGPLPLQSSSSMRRTPPTHPPKCR